MPQFASAIEKCHECSKSVYATEKITVDDKEDKRTYHKACLKCTHCKKVLSLGNYASMGGVYYCKPHFKQLFATKGNYDEGFGKDKLTSKWAPSAAPATSSAVSFIPVEASEPKKEAADPARFKKAAVTTPTSFVPVESTSTSAEKKETPAAIANRFKKPTTAVTTPTSFVPVESTSAAPAEKKETPTAIANRFKKPASSVSGFVPVESTSVSTSEKKETPTGIANRFKGNSDKCTVCSKTAYALEKIVVEDKDDRKVFHKNCFKCQHCAKVLSLGNYAAMGGIYYCKPHFKQLFATKGNYDEGFGKQKHTAKWLEQGENADEASSTTSHEEDTTTVSTHEHEHEHEEREAEEVRDAEPVSHEDEEEEEEEEEAAHHHEHAEEASHHEEHEELDEHEAHAHADVDEERTHEADADVESTHRYDEEEPSPVEEEDN